MKYRALCLVVVACSIASAPSMAAQATQPPMDQFNNAFYNCDNGGAFLISYDSGKPKTAVLTTSNNSKQYELKRSPVSMGVKFADAGTSFWTDGETVTIEGTEIPLQNCKRKSN